MTKIRIAGPPGTGKTRYLVKIFYNHLLQNYAAPQMIVTSHTNTAADEIRKRIKDPKSIQEYQNETGCDGEIFHLIKESRKTLDVNVTTIHKYCMSKIPGKDNLVFSGDDYVQLKIQHPLFDHYSGSKEFHTLDMLIAGHPFFKFQSVARDNGLTLVEYYRALVSKSYFREIEKYKYTLTELQKLEEHYNNFKNNEKINQRAKRILDFQDMVQHFTESDQIRSEDLGIKILMVDEAQDSSVIQRAAEKKMAGAVEYFYKAGDPDQSIFEFAGANPDSFHKEFARPEVELKQGFRCPRLINEYCKKIIKPIWEDYEYTRVWAPRKENGQIVEGELYEMMNLKQDPHLAELTKRLTQTNETFAFTCRGNEPKETINYLMKLGLPFEIPKKDKKFNFKYPAVHITNQRNFLKLIRENEKLTSAAIKKILKNTHPDYVGKNYSVENVDNIEKDKKFDFKWLIKHQFLNPIVKESDDFQNINKIDGIEMKNFIRNVVKHNRDLEETPRIFLENIHTIKGKEFDNVIVDLTLTREEGDYTKRRIKYVACSRAKKTLWLIKSKNGGMTL